TLKLCLEYFWCGFKDAFAWPSGLITIYGSQTIKNHTLKCFVLNGVIFLGSIFFFNHVTLPTLHFFLGESFFALNHRGNGNDIGDALDVKSPLITKVLDTIVALTYQLLWVYPIFILSFVLNAIWYQEIADRAFRMYYGPPINSRRTYPRALKVMADEIYRALLFMNYLIVATLVYKWINQGWSLEQRIGYFEERWSYFAGFGFLFTVITFFVDQFLSAGVFALFFPLYIIMATNAIPMPRHDERDRFSSLVPYRLRIFWVAKKLNDKIIGSLNRGQRRLSFNRENHKKK
ncbi:18024_t:CDS:2, partial [Dentiscutata erythropus]